MFQTDPSNMDFSSGSSKPKGETLVSLGNATISGDRRPLCILAKSNPSQEDIPEQRAHQSSSEEEQDSDRSHAEYAPGVNNVG